MKARGGIQMPKKEPIKWIFTRRAEMRGPGPGEPGAYFGPDGQPAYKSDAAELGSWQTAKEFADSHGINVDDVMVSIVVK
jgi:hypothetical protein